MSTKVVRLELWPPIDRTAWVAALAEGDIFDGRGLDRKSLERD